MSFLNTKLGRNDPCPCGATKQDGSFVKYKKCCLNKLKPEIPPEVIKHFMDLPNEPFEKGGFLTGRPFITELFNGKRMRAVANVIYQRPLTETFHIFLFRRLSEILSREWVEAQEQREYPHPIIQWYKEAQAMIAASENLLDVDTIRGVKLTGNMRSLLALAYDFYSLQHCGAPVLPKLLNRLRNEQQFQGARYEIAVAGLVCRAGFKIKWVQQDSGKHCEFVGTHKVTGDRAAFEVKSHHRDGVLGHGEGTFNAEYSRIKIIDHVKEAVSQAPDDEIPLIIFDDLNLPLTTGIKLNEKKWFKDVEEQLEKYGFLNMPEYKRCGALFITNFSWHFHFDVPPEQNELLTHFHLNGKYSLKPETILQYIDLAAKQYGYVPALQHELQILK